MPVTIQGPVPLAPAGYFAVATWLPTAVAYSAGTVMDTLQPLIWRNVFGAIFLGGELMVTSSRLYGAHTAVIAGETSYDLAVYNAPPADAHANTAAWDVTAAARDVFQGKIGLGTPVDLGSTIEVETDGINRQITVLPGGISYAELITVGGFTPSAVGQFRRVTLHGTAI